MTEAERAPILLTGASGRVGHMVLRHWPRARVGVVPQYRRGAPRGGLLWVPATGPRALLEYQAQRATRFRALVMLSGVTPGEGRDVTQNRAIAEATLVGAQAAGINRVIVASSSAVYGAGEGFAEEDRCAPANLYGAAKLDMEAACARWRDRGLEVCALRIGNVAGADALLVNAARNAGQITLDCFADGTGPLRSYIGPRSLAEALATLCLLDGPLPQVLNIAAPVPITMAALAQEAGATIRSRPAPPTAHQRITLDCRRIAAFHPFAPAESVPSEMVRQWRTASP